MRISASRRSMRRTSHDGQTAHGSSRLWTSSTSSLARASSVRSTSSKVKPFKTDKKWQKLSIMPRRIPLSELIPSMPYPSPTARSRLTFELSRQTGLRRKPKGNISPCIIAVPRWAGDSKRGNGRDAERCQRQEPTGLPMTREQFVEHVQNTNWKSFKVEEYSIN